MNTTENEIKPIETNEPKVNNCCDSYLTKLENLEQELLTIKLKLDDALTKKEIKKEEPTQEKSGGYEW